LTKEGVIFMSRFFISTRPTLTADLMQNGFTPEPTVNVYHPERPAWRFDLSAELCEVIASYYTRIEKPIPRNVTEFMAQAQARAGE